MTIKNNKVIFIAGPTAVGKTKYAIEIAKKFDGEIVSADSMQIYKYMDIGSAKPTKEELAEAKHYMVDEIDPESDFSVAVYQKMAKGYINQIFEEGKQPIVSGGTGLYLNSLIYDMDFSVMSKKDDLRTSLEKEAAEFGNEYIHDKLKALDMECSLRIHPNNVKKVIRAIEVLLTSGQAINEFEKSFNETKDYETLIIGLNRNRDELYKRIDLRVDQLMEQGLLSEIENLLKLGLTEKNISMKGIGYKEIIGHLNGEYDLQEAIRLVKRNTRHYAKRQITWLKRYEKINWFNLSDYENEDEALLAIFELIKSKE